MLSLSLSTLSLCALSERTITCILSLSLLSLLCNDTSGEEGRIVYERVIVETTSGVEDIRMCVKTKGLVTSL